MPEGSHGHRQDAEIRSPTALFAKCVEGVFSELHTQDPA